MIRSGCLIPQPAVEPTQWRPEAAQTYTVLYRSGEGSVCGRDANQEILRETSHRAAGRARLPRDLPDAQSVCLESRGSDARASAGCRMRQRTPRPAPVCLLPFVPSQICDSHCYPLSSGLALAGMLRHLTVAHPDLLRRALLRISLFLRLHPHSSPQHIDLTSPQRWISTKNSTPRSPRAKSQ